MTTGQEGSWRARLDEVADAARARGQAWSGDTVDSLLAAVLASQIGLDRSGDHRLSLQVLDAYEHALGAVGVSPSDPRWGQAAYRRMLGVERLGRVAEARALAEALIGRAEQQGWSRVLLSVLRRMAFHAGQAGDRRQQEALLERALQLARELGDPLEQADVLRYVANAQLNRGDPAASLALMQQARALMVQGGASAVRIAQVDTPIAGRLIEQQELGRAQTVLERSLSVFQEVRHAWGETECRLSLGRILEMEGDLEGALAQVLSAEAVMTQAEDPRGVARCANRLGELHRRVGRLDRAEAAYRSALRAAALAEHVNLQALVLSNLAQVAEARGQPAEARALLERCLALPGLMASSAAGLRVLLLPILEQEGGTAAWESQYHLCMAGLRNTDRFQRDVAMAARRSGEASVLAATGLTGAARRAALSRAARSHAMAWHHWGLMGFPAEESHEEDALRAVGRAGAPIPLGDFDLVGPLGVGGMGEVWRAVHRASGLPVAVKVLTAARARSELVQASFRGEVRAMAALNHPHVALVLGQGLIDVPASRASDGRLEPGSPYLVMELAPEGSLESRCGQLHWSHVKQILLALLDGLAHAHARGLIHRDLKPANVLLGEGTILASKVRLTDFGVAAAMGGGGRLARVAAGTPGYMAPEQFLARWRDQGPWTDLYALGCVATELVQGAPPFVASTLGELRQLHLTALPPRLDPTVGVPAGFQAWVARLLHKQPQARYQRAVDAAHDLRLLGPAVRPAEPEPVVRRLPGAVSESTLFLEDWLPEDPGPPRIQETLPPATQHTLTHAPPRDPDVRAALVQAGLSLFGLRILPVVGRDAEQQVLWRSLAQCLSARVGHGVVLQGPVGIGRTRLLSWLGEHAHAAAGATVIPVAHVPDAEPAEALRALLVTWLGLQELTAAEIGARLGGDRPGLAGLSDDERVLLLGFLDGRLGGPGRERRHLRTLVARMLVEAAGVRPVVVLLDDIQWGDDTLALATALLRATAPVLVVLAARDDGAGTAPRLTRRLGAYASHPAVSVLPLGPLTPGAFRGLVRDQLGLAPPLAHQVEERAAGHPAFAVQLVTDWLARDVLSAGPDGLSLRVGGRLVVPDGLHEAWALPVVRLTERFGVDGRGALEVAAVLGQRVGDAEWAGACAAAGLPVPEGLQEALLDERLVRPIEGGWRFVHAPFRACLVQGARDQGRHARWHRACADALAGRGDALARRGRHQLQGGRPSLGFADLIGALETLPEDAEADRRQRLADDAQEALDAAGATADDPRRGRWAAAAGPAG